MKKMETSDCNQEKKTKGINRREFLKVAGGTIALTAIPSFSQLTAHVQENVQNHVKWDGSHAVSPLVSHTDQIYCLVSTL